MTMASKSARLSFPLRVPQPCLPGHLVGSARLCRDGAGKDLPTVHSVFQRRLIIVRVEHLGRDAKLLVRVPAGSSWRCAFPRSSEARGSSGASGCPPWRGDLFSILLIAAHVNGLPVFPARSGVSPPRQ